MSYKVDPKTLLFTDLSFNEMGELHEFCKKIVLEGLMNGNHPSFQAWVKVGNFDERQSLLVYATVFPQRSLLSLTLLAAELSQKGITFTW